MAKPDWLLEQLTISVTVKHMEEKYNGYVPGRIITRPVGGPDSGLVLSVKRKPSAIHTLSPALINSFPLRRSVAKAYAREI
ncbi:MAG: hypothetical protein ACKVKF_23395, partial [Rhodobacterales bacterium]